MRTCFNTKRQNRFWNVGRTRIDMDGEREIKGNRAAGNGFSNGLLALVECVVRREFYFCIDLTQWEFAVN